MFPPTKIKIESDGNLISYVRTIPVSKSSKEMFVYKYVKVGEKSSLLGTEVFFTKDELLKQLSFKFKEI